MKVLLLLVAGTKRQHEAALPSLNNAKNNVEFDLLYISRNFSYFPSKISCKKIKNIYFENKMSPSKSFNQFLKIDKSNNELEYRAFGAYRYYSMKYHKKYDVIICMSDDVYIRRDNWISDILNVFLISEYIGVVSNQVRNNPRHFRAPFFAISSSCINKLEKLDLWNFRSDHDAECRFGNQVAEAGFISVQLGNEFNLCTDYEWNYRGYHPRYCATPLPVHALEREFLGSFDENKIFDYKDIQEHLNIFGKPSDERNIDYFLKSNDLSATDKNQMWNIFFEFQPFNGLIHNGGQNIAFKYDLIKDIYSNEKKFLQNCGWIYNRKKPEFNFDRYFASGVNRLNPIITIF